MSPSTPDQLYQEKLDACFPQQRRQMCCHLPLLSDSHSIAISMSVGSLRPRDPRSKRLCACVSTEGFDALHAAGQSSLFTLSANNAVVQLLNRGGPRVLENQVLGHICYTHATSQRQMCIALARERHTAIENRITLCDDAAAISHCASSACTVVPWATLQSGLSWRQRMWRLATPECAGTACWRLCMWQRLRQEVRCKKKLADVAVTHSMLAYSALCQHCVS